MPTSKEMRREAWELLWQGRWFSRFCWITFLYLMLNIAVSTLLAQPVLFSAMPQELAAAIEECQKSGSCTAVLAELTRPGVLPRVLPAFLFTAFLNLMLVGMITIGYARVSLNAVGHVPVAEWRKGAFSGVRSPFGSFLMVFRLAVQIFLWSLLLLVPGVVAFYRYRLAWFVKARNLDRSAGDCIAQSARLMNGSKWRLFRFDCSYWLSFAILLLPGFVTFMLALLAVAGAVPPEVHDAVAQFAAFVVVPISLVVNFYMILGQAVFYRHLAATAHCGGAEEMV